MKTFNLKRIFIGIFLFISSIAQSAPTDLASQLKLKEIDYKIVVSYYEDLIGQFNKNDLKGFCDSVVKIKPTLNQIFYDDQALVKSLAQKNDPDFYDYSQHIDDNSRSDLFANGSHLDSCQNNGFEPRDQFLLALKYSLMNEQYLSQNHGLWMNAHPK